MDGHTGDFPGAMILPIMLHEYLPLLSLSAWGAVAKHRRSGGVNSRSLFAAALEAGKLKVKVPTDAAPGEHSSELLADTCFPLCPPIG